MIRGNKTARAPICHQRPKTLLPTGLTLAGLEPWIGLVDNIDPALAADQLVIAMALHQALERIAYFHETPVNGQWPESVRARS